MLHIASSSVTAGQIQSAADAAAAVSLTRCCGTQIHRNLLARDVERDVMPGAGENNTGTVPFFALASDMPTGSTGTGSPARQSSKRQPRGAFEEPTW